MTDPITMFRCPNGWQMPSSNVASIARHKSECALCRPAPFDVDRVIDDAARGIKPEEPLSFSERMQVAQRLLTMTPEECYERMFRSWIAR